MTVGVSRVKSYGKPRKFNSHKSYVPVSHQKGDSSCSRCGRGPHSLADCPAKGKICSLCQKMGHFSKFCWTNTKKVNEIEDIQHDIEELFLGSIVCEDSSKDWTVNVRMNGSNVVFKLDTGADTSVISENTYTKLLDKPQLNSVNNVKLSSPGGPLKLIGQFMANVNLNGTDYSFRVFVLKGNGNNLLGRSVVDQMGLVKFVNDVFGDLGVMDTSPVKIHLKDNAIPYSLNTPRRIPIPLTDKVRAEIDRMVKLDVVCKIEEPTEGVPQWFLY